MLKRFFRIGGGCVLALAFAISSACGQGSTETSSQSKPPSGTPHTAPRYQIVDLGPVQRLSSDIVPALNDEGDTTTWRQDDDMSFAPVLHGRATTALAKLAGYRNSFAVALNEQGNAAGWSNTTPNPVDSTATVHATLFSETSAVDLGTLGGLYSRAYAINPHGIVVGVSDLKDGQQRGFRYANGKMEPLKPLPKGISSMARDINRQGTIAGASGVAAPGPDPVTHAVLWRHGVTVDLGVLPGGNKSYANALNNHDEVVGSAVVRGEQAAFLYTHGRMKDLHIEGAAYGINDKSQIVGTITPEERGSPRGFLWENGKMQDLNTLIPPGPFRIQSAYRINNAGQILCTGPGQDRMHAFLLNPVQP